MRTYHIILLLLLLVLYVRWPTLPLVLHPLHQWKCHFFPSLSQYSLETLVQSVLSLITGVDEMVDVSIYRDVIGMFWCLFFDVEGIRMIIIKRKKNNMLYFSDTCVMRFFVCPFQSFLINVSQCNIRRGKISAGKKYLQFSHVCQREPWLCVHY